jgi:hypothetical protein
MWPRSLICCVENPRIGGEFAMLFPTRYGPREHDALVFLPRAIIRRDGSQRSNCVVVGAHLPGVGLESKAQRRDTARSPARMVGREASSGSHRARRVAPKRFGFSLSGRRSEWLSSRRSTSREERDAVLPGASIHQRNRELRLGESCFHEQRFHMKASSFKKPSANASFCGISQLPCARLYALRAGQM